ncbi:MAG: NUDIX hydrolase [Tumebacillaceae bacterium]
MSTEALKVTAYITRVKNGKPQLLVFKEQRYEHLGLQVPGGTVEAGETLEEAVLREIWEEAGLTELRLVSLLGESHYFFEKKQQHTRRAYFHLTVDECDDTFTYIVQGDGIDRGWVYHYSWIDVKQDAPPTLYNRLGDCLVKLSETLCVVGEEPLR